MKQKTKEELRKENNELNELNREYINRLQRMQAEFDNFKKRCEIEKLEFIKFANKDLMLKLLDILDSFELALKDKNNNEEFINGVELIHKQLVSLLEKEGLQRIKAMDEVFNPNLHEVLLKEDGNKQDNLIVGEIQPGYKIHDKILRFSKVKINKNNGGNQK